MYSQRSTRGATTHCSAFLELDGRVDLETADGLLRVTRAATILQRRANSGPLSFGFTERVGEQQGSLSIPLLAGETGTLDYRLDGSGPSCAGEIMLVLQESTHTRTTSSGGPLASWSNSACRLGMAPFDLAQPVVADGQTLPALIETLWANASYTGRWEDGGETELELHVVVPSGTVCHQQGPTGAVEVPVRATYRTSDARINLRTTDAFVRASLRADSSVNQLDFWLSDEMRCSSQEAELDYTLADCSAAEGATVQFGLNYYGDGSSDVRELTVYFERRGGGEPLPSHHLFF